MVEQNKVVSIDRSGRVNRRDRTDQFDTSIESKIDRVGSYDITSTPATRLSDGVNLALMVVGIVILVRVVNDPTTGLLTAAIAIVLCGLALAVAWQVVRRNWLPAKMPRRWGAEERRVKWLQTAHTCIALAGAVGYFGFVCLWAGRHQLVPRTVFPVIVFGYLVVQALFTGFFRDHLPPPAPRYTRRRSIFDNMQPIRSERWGDRGL